MIITIQEICQWVETDPGKRNFIGGEKVLNVGHLTTCRKVKDDYDANNIKLFALCIRSSGTTTNEILRDFTSLIFVAFFHATNTSIFSGLPK